MAKKNQNNTASETVNTNTVTQTTSEAVKSKRGNRGGNHFKLSSVVVSHEKAMQVDRLSTMVMDEFAKLDLNGEGKIVERRVKLASDMLHEAAQRLQHELTKGNKVGASKEEKANKYLAKYAKTMGLTIEQVKIALAVA